MNKKELVDLKNLKRIQNPVSRFNLYFPTNEKMQFIAQKLHNEFLFLSDEYREQASIWQIVNQLQNTPVSLFYEINKNNKVGGLVGFISIVPGFKCDVFFRFWDKNVFSHNVVKDAKKLFLFIMETFSLQRINTWTADKRVLKLAQLLGFKIEGKRVKNFKWDGKYYDTYFIGLLFKTLKKDKKGG